MDHAFEVWILFVIGMDLLVGSVLEDILVKPSSENMLEQMS